MGFRRPKHGLAQSVFQAAVTWYRRARCWRPSSCCPAASRAWRGFSVGMLGIVVLINAGTGTRRTASTPGARGWIAGIARPPRVTASRHRGGCWRLVFSKKVHLAREPHELLNLLSHRPTFHVSVAVRSAAVRVSGRAAWRRGWRPPGDRLGSKYIIWASILGVLPFTRHSCADANLFWTCVLTVPIGLIISSAFPAIVVYAQDPAAGRTGWSAGTVLRTGVRHGQRRSGGARQARGPQRHRFRRYQVCVSCR